jgi:hypothetical protein
MTGGAIRTAGVAATFSLALGACANRHPPPPHLDVPQPPAAAAPKPTPLAAPPPVVVRVPVPVKEACIPKSFPRAPKYPDTDAALRDAGGAADRYQLMAAGRLLRDRRLADLERVVDGCR